MMALRWIGMHLIGMRWIDCSPALHRRFTARSLQAQRKPTPMRPTLQSRRRCV